MPMLIDTSALVAAANPREARHRDAVSALEAHSADGLVLPASVLAEALCFVNARYGIANQRRLWDALRESSIEVVPLDSALVRSARLIDERYVDIGFGFVDCTLLACCEARRIARILTFDRRLGAYRPTLAPSVELLP